MAQNTHHLSGYALIAPFLMAMLAILGFVFLAFGPDSTAQPSSAPATIVGRADYVPPSGNTPAGFDSIDGCKFTCKDVGTTTDCNLDCT